MIILNSDVSLCFLSKMQPLQVNYVVIDLFPTSQLAVWLGRRPYSTVWPQSNSASAHLGGVRRPYLL